MTILTEAGKDAVDNLSDAVEKIEEEVREDLLDAINALRRYEWREDGMDGSPNGDYLDRGEVLQALDRSRR
jgi:hypothetical protein